MNKTEFLDELRACLAGLPVEDVSRSLDYYTEAIEDRVEDGMTEEKATADLGAPKEIAERILAEIPLTRLVKNKLKPKKKLSALTLTLLIVGSPIWVSLAIAAVAVIISVYVALWAVIVSLYATTLALALGGAVGGVCYLISYAMAGNVAGGVALLGLGILASGLSVFLFIGSSYCTKLILRLSRVIFLFIKSLFVRKEKVA